MRQWQSYTHYYKEQAGKKIAEQFIISVENALKFIEKTPNACAIYDAGEENPDLQKHNFRKWGLIGFPHVILFRISNNNCIFIEVIYATKMDIASRLKKMK